MEEVFYTTGEFAKKAGITLRTLRYYDKINLLKPSSHNPLGNRLYSKHDFPKLQKILTLKFIGLSLDEIKNIMTSDIYDEGLRNSLEIQKEIMNRKVHHINTVINSIDETLDMMDNESDFNWDKFINIINVVNEDKKWLLQYENASNLRARINIHELYSTNKYGWMNWFFDELTIKPKSKILEVGCGDGSLWLKNFKKAPDDLELTLTDFSNGMIKDAKNNLKVFKGKIKFKVVDVQNIPFDDSSFDIVIANHMLYHVPDKEKALSEIFRVLKTGGQFYASTVGKKHLHEMREIAAKFDSSLLNCKSWDATQSFQLENGKELIEKLFREVQIKRYEDSLIVTKAEPLAEYIFSLPEIKSLLTDKKKIINFLNFLRTEIANTNGIHITKDTGFFKTIKKS